MTRDENASAPQEAVEIRAEGGADPILLYDGVCGFCNKSVQTILAHDSKGTLRFAPLQSRLGESILKTHRLEGVDSVVFIDRSSQPERVYLRSDAALNIARYLGGGWNLLMMAKLLPRPVRDFFYDLFARYRYRIFGKYDNCMVPPPEVRSRFLDLA